jgi:hypothetical protein
MPRDYELEEREGRGMEELRIRFWIPIEDRYGTDGEEDVGVFSLSGLCPMHWCEIK